MRYLKFKFYIISYVFITGCAIVSSKPEGIITTYSSEQTYSDENKMTIFNRTEFLSLTQSLIEDALDLLPKEIADVIAPNENLDEIINGVSRYDPNQSSLNHSIESENFGFQTSFIVYQIYRENLLSNDAQIPQAIYYNGFGSTDITNVIVKITSRQKEIKKSNSPDRDRYNLAVNILTDLWINNFIKSGRIISKMPKEGVYLRDQGGSLYAYDVSKNEK